MTDSQKKTVLTCAQPTGQLHLGNYLGAVKNWVALLDDYECYFGVVDLHAITVPYTPAELRANTLQCVAQYVACGLDPERCRIFVQSQIIGHTELAWVLGCITPLGSLQRMTQFKDKSAKQEKVGSGLLYYPVLMAADILIYNADLVPVGEDQKQHLELTRDLAGIFNHTYSPTFTVPEPHIGKEGARVMSLQNPTAKMSKSDPNQSGTLYLFEEERMIRKKIMSAVTDSGNEIKASPKKPGITNLLNIFSAATGQSISRLESDFEGKTYADFKAAVADAVVEMLTPLQKRYAKLKDDKKYLGEIIESGREAAQRRANRIMSKVYRKAGFVQRT